uniref:HepT-like domain-containing protein n=1 Tax=Cyanothece sp. (strain PCC 7425 / ATCC 29141) TaxID=395961 RepID=B8HZM1_CYAP4
MSQYTVLVARLQNELSMLDKVVAKAQSQVSKAQQSGDADFYQAAALSLQNYYMGVERIFEEVAKQVDQSLPSGASSHRVLLEQMSLEIPLQVVIPAHCLLFWAIGIHQDLHGDPLFPFLIPF